MKSTTTVTIDHNAHRADKAWLEDRGYDCYAIIHGNDTVRVVYAKDGIEHRTMTCKDMAAAYRWARELVESEADSGPDCEE